MSSVSEELRRKIQEMAIDSNIPHTVIRVDGNVGPCTLNPSAKLEIRTKGNVSMFNCFPAYPINLAPRVYKKA
jgi:hypothetical protein